MKGCLDNEDWRMEQSMVIKDASGVCGGFGQGRL